MVSILVALCATARVGVRLVTTTDIAVYMPSSEGDMVTCGRSIRQLLLSDEI